jgi:hypothetical protein
MQGFGGSDSSDQLGEAGEPNFILHDDALRLGAEIAEVFNARNALQGR